MARATWKIITSTFIISLICCSQIKGCGWYENDETTRLALFRAELSGMSGFRPFYYSAFYYNTTSPDPEGVDKHKNCKEWMQRLGKGVTEDDIFTILYETEPEQFQLAYEKNRLLDSFPKNTFIIRLMLKQNK